MLEREGRILLWIRQTCGDFDGQILYMSQLRLHFIHDHGRERCIGANASSLKHAGKRLFQNPSKARPAFLAEIALNRYRAPAIKVQGISQD
jgi:hypothetical protein